MWEHLGGKVAGTCVRKAAKNTDNIENMELSLALVQLWILVCYSTAQDKPLLRLHSLLCHRRAQSEAMTDKATLGHRYLITTTQPLLNEIDVPIHRWRGLVREGFTRTLLDKLASDYVDVSPQQGVVFTLRVS